MIFNNFAVARDCFAVSMFTVTNTWHLVIDKIMKNYSLRKKTLWFQVASYCCIMMLHILCSAKWRQPSTRPKIWLASNSTPSTPHWCTQAGPLCGCTNYPVHLRCAHLAGMLLPPLTGCSPQHSQILKSVLGVLSVQMEKGDLMASLEMLFFHKIYS